ncbi:MAG: hypothetical protein O3A00_14915 [Planctomycetota bacterium]|nr:hypothetical protein [Planctomycetota bacterium]
MGRGSLKWNVIATWITHAAGLLSGIFLMPFVLGTLGDGAYGIWVFINSIVGYAGLFHLGFGATTGRYVATHSTRGEWDELNRVMTAVLTFYSCAAIVVLLAACGLAWIAPSIHAWEYSSIWEIRTAILILGVNFAISLMGSGFGGLLMGVQRFDIERGVGLVSLSLRLGLTFFFLTADYGLLTLSLITLTLTLVENLSYMFFAFREVPQLSVRRRHFEWVTLKKCVSCSVFFALDSLAGMLIYFTDTVVIGFVLGTGAIVPYVIAQRLCQFIAKPIEQLGSIFMMRTGALHADARTEEIQRLLVRGVGFTFLLITGLFIGAGFFGDILIKAWVGEGYWQSHHLLLVLLGARVISVPVGMFRNILFGVGCIRTTSLIIFSEAMLNLLISLVLVHFFGLMGVALGTAIPLVLVSLGVLVPYACRQLNIRLAEIVRSALGPQLLPLIVLLMYSMAVTSTIPLEGNWQTLLIVATGGGLILGLAFWFNNWMAKSLSVSPIRLVREGG